MKHSKPLLVGITGGIGSGKSLICRIFTHFGVPVYEADSRAKWLMHHHSGLRTEITTHFGESAYQPDGSLNRAYLAAQVFNQSARVEQLNALVHPKVAEDFSAWVDQHHTFPYLLKEAALLFESGSYRTLDFVITVSAPIDLRIGRVLQRDPHRTEAEIRAIINKQWSEESRLAKANYVLHNDDQQMVLPQVVTLHKQLLQIAGQSRL